MVNGSGVALAGRLAGSLYCERGSEAFWAEPLNALTNLAFLVAALFMARRLRAADPGVRGADLWLLIGLAGSIGIGSFLWHTLAVPWAALADVIPIGLFIGVYLIGFLRRVAARGWPTVASLLALYLLATAAVQAGLPPTLANGSLLYLPALAMLVAMAVYAHRTRHPQRGLLRLMLGLFLVSLALRTLDIALCGLFPAGTHFLWHLLNAWVLYLGMRVLVD